MPKPEPVKTVRTRLPMDKFKAAYAIDRILGQLPPEDRLVVLEFVKVPRQTAITGTEGHA